jgi:hypothetical protein
MIGEEKENILILMEVFFVLLPLGTNKIISNSLQKPGCLFCSSVFKQIYLVICTDKLPHV